MLIDRQHELLEHMAENILSVVSLFEKVAWARVEIRKSGCVEDVEYVAIIHEREYE
jgi:dihydroneopterin aldolase